MKNRSNYWLNALNTFGNQLPFSRKCKNEFSNSPKILKKKAIVFIGLLLLFSMPTFAQNSCQTQLLNIGYLYGTRGYQCVYEKYNNLNDGYFRNHEVYLSAGSYYELCAVCDNDCEDIDIKLYDGLGNLIAQDESTDDLPVVSCTVISSGYFTVKVIMADCSEEPCNYGLAVFGR